MRKITNEIWELQKFGSDRLAKYMRCLFQAMLPCNPDYPLRIIEEVEMFVKEAAQVKSLVLITFRHVTDTDPRVTRLSPIMR